MKLKKALEEKYKFGAAILAVLMLIIFFLAAKSITTQKTIIGPEITDNSIITVKHIKTGSTLTLETAATQQKREMGLMHRDSLNPDSGMIFIFPSETDLSFWMKNTSISLDMIFLDKDLKVTSISRNTKINQTVEIYSSKSPSQFAIETINGWVDSHSVAQGDYFEIIRVK